MIRNGHLLDALHRRYDQERLANLSIEDALATYGALWALARALGADGARDWQADIEPTLAVARMLNAPS